MISGIDDERAYAVISEWSNLSEIEKQAISPPTSSKTFTWQEFCEFGPPQARLPLSYLIGSRRKNYFVSTEYGELALTMQNIFKSPAKLLESAKINYLLDSVVIKNNKRLRDES